jgi:hypothetical protein
MINQCARVLRHLKDYGSITAMEAIKEYGIMRLASRISDLKAQGYPVKREIITDKNRYGEKTHYARYTLVTDKEGN